MRNPGSSYQCHDCRKRGSNIPTCSTADVLWGARCVNCARRVLTGGWGGDSPSLPDLDWLAQLGSLSLGPKQEIFDTGGQFGLGRIRRHDSSGSVTGTAIVTSPATKSPV